VTRLGLRNNAQKKPVRNLLVGAERSAGAQQAPRYPSSSADSFPLLLRARNKESSRSPGEKAATV